MNTIAKASLTTREGSRFAYVKDNERD